MEDNNLTEIGIDDQFDFLSNVPDIHNNEYKNASKNEDVSNENDTSSIIQDANPVNDIKSLLKIHAEQWKSDGRLPEDFIIDDSLTEDAIDNAFYKHKYNQIRSEILNEIKEKEGLTEDDIIRLRGKKLNVDQKLYDSYKAYSDLSVIDLSDENDIVDYIKLYYRDINLPESSISKLISEDDLNVDEKIISAARDHFKNKSENIKRQIDEKEDSILQAEAKKKIDRENADKLIIASKKIGKLELSDDQVEKVKSALFDKTEVAKLPDGSTKKVTKYQKKILEYSADPVSALEMRIRFIIDDIGTDNAEEKANKNILKQLTNSLITDKISSSGGKLPMREI